MKLTLTQILFDACVSAYIQHMGLHSVHNPTWRKFKLLSLFFFALSVASINVRFYGDAIELMSPRGMEVLSQNMSVLLEDSVDITLQK